MNADTELTDTYWREIVDDNQELDQLSQDLFRMSQTQPHKLITVYRSRADDSGDDNVNTNEKEKEDVNPPADNNNEIPHHSRTDTPPRTDTPGTNREADFGLLTQLLEPKKSRRPASTSASLENFKQTFLEKTTTLDRARAHLESLANARDRDRIPNKLKINIEPLVIDKDNRNFRNKWNDELRKCEKNLLSLLIDHLNHTIADTISTIRSKSDQCLDELKRTQTEDQAKSSLQTILEDAEKTRQERKEAATKHKRERTKSNNDRTSKEAKRPKTD